MKKKNKSTKKSLVMSAISLVLCVAMLMGTTFAWFTDSVSSGVNKIQAGNLDVEVLHTNAKINTPTSIQGVDEMFPSSDGRTMKWEPGAVSYEELTVKNIGSLALKYNISMNIVGKNTVMDSEGNNTGKSLLDVLKVKMLDSSELIAPINRDNVADLDWSDAATLSTFVKENRSLYPTTDTNLGHVKSEKFQLIIYWPQSANDNDWNLQNGKYASDSNPTEVGELWVNFGINLVATQLEHENDSFGNNYDTNAATYLNKDAQGNYLISNADELVFFATAINTKIAPYSDANNTFKLTADIDLGGRRWAPIGRMTGTYGIGERSTFQGNFDGGNHTISNFNVDTVDGVAGDDTNKGAGLFGAVTGTISNLKVTDATIVTAHWAGTITGQIQGTVKNCSVENITITCLPELIGTSWDNGDKAGSIVGYLDTNGTVTGCSAKNVSITGYRDLGGIVGYSNGTVTNNTVGENVDITYDNDATRNYNNYTSAAQHNIGDYIGRGADENDVDNTGTANYVRGETAGTAEELRGILEGYASNSGESITVELTKDFDMANSWTTYNIGNYNGVNSLTINGNGHKITNLKAPLLMGAFAGGGVITINDLTISNANIAQNSDKLGIGAFIMHSDASGGVAFNNCKLENSVINCTGANAEGGSAYAGGFIGYSSSDNTTFKNCSVTNCQISGKKSAGALIGHAQNNLTVDSCTVTQNTISETLENRTSPGAAAIVGRVNAGTTITVKNTTVSGNTINQGQAVTSQATNVVCANADYTNGGNNAIQQLPKH